MTRLNVDHPCITSGLKATFQARDRSIQSNLGLPTEVTVRTLLLILLFSALFLRGAAHSGALFTENKGQWPGHVLYRALIPGGALFVEEKALTYIAATHPGHHHHADDGHDHADHETRWHIWRMHFQDGAALSSAGFEPLSHKESYFIGNDPAAWGSGCQVFR
jgi:hypothetical protein